MLDRVNIKNVLVLDIETVPQSPSYSDLQDDWKKLWDTKSTSLVKYHEGQTNETLYPRAGIYAEFGKIVCVSCGVIQGNDEQRKIVLKSFYGDDEKKLLTEFIDMLNKWATGEAKFLCAHNGKKPWEVNHYDTLELWKFGDYKSFTSLNLLAHVLGVPTPKDDIDGSMVWEVYWKEKNLERIVTYCQKDVVTVAQILLRMNGEQLIKEENIEIK